MRSISATVDVLNLNGGSFNLVVANAETINGSAAYDAFAVGNTSGSTTVTAGAGQDSITASAGQDNFRFTSAADSVAGGATDIIANFVAGSDTFTFSGMTFAGGSIAYVEDAALAGDGQASARLQNVGVGNDVLQIDVDGDGVMIE